MHGLNQLVDLSIIVPIYNVEEYLEECLNSVYAIKGITTEVILINDGSTDSSITIINNFLSKFENKTIFINQDNKGLSGARNAGIAKTKGKYILFVDSDDLIVPEKVQFIVDYAVKNSLDLLQAKSRTFGDTASRVMPVPAVMLVLPVSSGRDYLQAYCNCASIKKQDFRPEAWLLLIKSTVLLENKLRFQEGMYFEDELMTPTILLHCNRVKMLDVIFYHYRIRPNSITTTFNEYHVKSKAMLATAYFNLIKEHKFYHPFVSCRLIGWCKEGLVYLPLKQLVAILQLRNIKSKDFILLISLILEKSLLLLSIKFKKQE
jgi:glycosyltransferase involved in cell wall biosynthesis